jgi:hypothetical protein
MNDETDFKDQSSEQPGEGPGSDELLAADDLRLPEEANILVRLHAVRAWLARRRDEAALAVGKATLALQAAVQPREDVARPRRRARQLEENPAGQPTHVARIQAQLQAAQATLAAFDEAQELLEECVAHMQGERVLVEFYLLIEQRLLDKGYLSHEEHPNEHAPWYEVMAEVLRRIEHVGIPEEP